MVLSAKPSEVPSILPRPVTIQQVVTPKPSGSSFNSAFEGFLQKNHKRVCEPLSGAKLLSSDKSSTSAVQDNIIVEPIRKQPTTSFNKPSDVSKVQQKQEAWTNKVLMQSQTSKPEVTQRATCERIQPYVAGQLQANRNDNGQQSYYTINKTSSPTSKTQNKIIAQKQLF